MTTPPTPAGWYPDPEQAGQLRYWDGGRWTEHRSPDPGAGGSGGARASPSVYAARGARTARRAVIPAHEGAHRAADAEPEPPSAPEPEVPITDQPTTKVPLREWTFEPPPLEPEATPSWASEPTTTPEPTPVPTPEAPAEPTSEPPAERRPLRRPHCRSPSSRRRRCRCGTGPTRRPSRRRTRMPRRRRRPSPPASTRRRVPNRRLRSTTANSSWASAVPSPRCCWCWSSPRCTRSSSTSPTPWISHPPPPKPPPPQSKRRRRRRSPPRARRRSLRRPRAVRPTVR